MIVYREQRRRIATRELLARIAAASGFERKMELAELEAGVADALCPERDDDLPVLRALRGGQWSGVDLPETVEVSVPEGFAYYAVDPELYRMAARRFVAEARPERVAAIGIRSIGTTLSSVVEAELRAAGVPAASWTVRPRGHPWQRELRVTDRLARAWREWSGWFAVVDEGPGLSGSSFASVAEFLGVLGVPDERIVLFPSWETDGSGFVSEAARARWQRHRRYSVAFEELSLFDGARDLSAGGWRSIRGVWPAVQPQHERRKYRRDGHLYKFAGYGRYGREKLERAARLGAFTASPLGIERGFLETRWVAGRPVRKSAAFIDHAARYLAFVRREFGTGETADTAALAQIIEVNTGRAWTGTRPEAEAVELDGRMLPHEWLETPRGFVKTDALDHADDHFFPGPQDIAWDLAACGIECGGAERLLERYVRESGDRDVTQRLPFYRRAYLAFRLGYADLAAQTLGDCDDGARWRRESARYAGLIESEEAWTKNRSRLSA